jgi:Uri superfamily endonuclease
MKRDSGTYALVLRSSTRRPLRVGRLGDLRARPGYYVYVGSAFGPGGVGARVGHHRKGCRRPHWHIDHLSGIVELNEVWYSHDRLHREHAWAALLETARGASIPLPRFGASDCECGSHLFFFARPPSLSGFRRRVRASLPDHGRVERLRMEGGRHGPEP